MKLNPNISIKKHSGVYTLEAEQELKMDINEAWSFLSNPQNLSKITPPHMGFKITSGIENTTYPGQIITYKVGILPFVKSNWVTEITHVKNNQYFIDEQRFGPYKLWHHLHKLSKTKDGVKMIDKISYKIPFGFIGDLMHSLFIKKQLLSIFSFRFETLAKTYGS